MYKTLNTDTRIFAARMSCDTNKWVSLLFRYTQLNFCFLKVQLSVLFTTTMKQSRVYGFDHQEHLKSWTIQFQISCPFFQVTKSNLFPRNLTESQAQPNAEVTKNLARKLKEAKIFEPINAKLKENLKIMERLNRLWKLYTV